MTACLVSGATGYAGRFIVEHCLAAGDHVIAMGRNPPQADCFSQPVEWVHGDLEPHHEHSSSFQDVDVFVHCAFHHEPGKFRGGEGDDPETFRRLNVDGSLRLFHAAKAAGVRRAIFLSSRAVYGQHAPGTVLTEETPLRPDTLYGQVKLDVEEGLQESAGADFLPLIVRPTGIYGAPRPGTPHKWQELFAGFADGVTPPPRVATEVHGDDLAAAIRLLTGLPESDLRRFGSAPAFNVSDIVLDRHGLLAAYAEAARVGTDLPGRSDASALNVMDCTRLKSVGWSPRGRLDLTGLA